VLWVLLEEEAAAAEAPAPPTPSVVEELSLKVRGISVYHF
jgi:hypothetical protein